MKLHPSSAIYTHSVDSRVGFLLYLLKTSFVDYVVGSMRVVLVRVVRVVRVRRVVVVLRSLDTFSVDYIVSNVKRIASSIVIGWSIITIATRRYLS